MNCGHVEQRLSDYLEGLVSRRAAQQITAHLDTCPACRHLRDEHTALRSELRGLANELPPPDPNLERRSVQRWLVGREQRAERRGFGDFGGFSWRLAVGACGAAVVVGALSLAAIRWRGNGGEARIVDRPAASSQEQVQVRAPLSLPRKREKSERAKGTEGQERETPTTVDPTSFRSPFALSSLSRFRGKKEALRPAPSPPADDLAVLNREPEAAVRRWAALSPAEWERIEARVRGQVRVKDEFVTVPFPRLAASSPRQIAAAAESYKREAAIVDARLAREVTVQQKGTALSDLCERLREETGIHLNRATRGVQVGTPTSKL